MLKPYFSASRTTIKPTTMPIAVAAMQTNDLATICRVAVRVDRTSQCWPEKSDKHRHSYPDNNKGRHTAWFKHVSSRQTLIICSQFDPSHPDAHTQKKFPWDRAVQVPTTIRRHELLFPPSSIGSTEEACAEKNITVVLAGGRRARTKVKLAIAALVALWTTTLVGESGRDIDVCAVGTVATRMDHVTG